MPRIVRRNDKIAEALRVLRARRALSIREAASRAKVSRDTLSALEKGEQTPNVPTLRKLAQSYGVSFEELLAAAVEEPQTVPKGEAPTTSARQEIQRLHDSGKLRLVWVTSLQQRRGEVEPVFLSEDLARMLLMELEGGSNTAPRVPVGTLEEPDGTVVTFYVMAERTDA